MTGLLVALEGAKLVGKTTLIDRLRDRVPSEDWLFTKEPTAAFDLGNEQRYCGEDLAARIAEDRAHHLNSEVRPALSDGRIVVTDRYILSSFVFHCLDGVDASTIERLNAGFPRPDILVVLQCSPSSLRTRRMTRKTSTRLSEAITVEQELLGYMEYADLCRPISGDVLIGYNERMSDCDALAERIIAEAERRKLADV